VVVSRSEAVPKRLPADLRKRAEALQGLRARVVSCRLCPRLVAYRERVAQEKVRRYRDQPYWGRPVPSFGDPNAVLLIVGLAPAAHGGNRTGRIFTGDRSGDFLFEALFRAGFSNQPFSRHKDDGLQLTNCYITAVLHCAPPANRPERGEIVTCRRYLLEEIELLARVRVVLALGRIAFESFLQAWGQAGRATALPRPQFGHGSESRLPGDIHLLASYHPSQQNTQTGRLTAAMFADVLLRARELVSN